MINLELLEIVSLAVAILALWRLRPATFIIAGNQLITLRALINIRDFGQPVTEWENPAAVFSFEHLARASQLFAVSTVILLALAIANPRGRPAKPAVLPSVPRWLLAFIAFYAVVAATASRTILQYGRTDPDRVVSEAGRSVTMSGVAPMLYSILLYELYRRVVTKQLRPAWAFLWVAVLFTMTDYLQGTTALASGYLTCGAILLLGAATGRPTARRRIAIGGLIVAAMVASAFIRNVRDAIWQDGWSAIDRFSTSLLREEPSRSQTGEGLESEGNGTGYAAHVLEGITLYDSGMSRHWQSFIDPLIYTFEPSFLVAPLGLARPTNAAVELQHIFTSGGGSYILGELYWNGGFPCLLLGFFLLAFWAFLCDTRYRSSALWLMLACQFAPSLLESIGYGMTHTFRCWFDGLLVVGVYYLAVRLKRSPGRAVALNAPIASPLNQAVARPSE